MSFEDVVEREQRREIERLTSGIKEQYDQDGALEVAFFDPDDMELGEGWAQYYLYGTEGFDAWMREAEPGAYLPEHVYPNNHLYLVLLEGEAEATIGGQTKTIDEGSATLQLQPGTTLSMEAKEKTRMIAVFRPPISRP